MLSPAASQYTTDFGSPVGDYDTTVQLVHMSQYTCNLNKFSGVHQAIMKEIATNLTRLLKFKKKDFYEGIRLHRSHDFSEKSPWGNKIPGIFRKSWQYIHSRNPDILCGCCSAPTVSHTLLHSAFSPAIGCG